MATLNLPEKLHLLSLKEVADQLRAALATSSHSDITSHILNTVESGIYPASIFKIWFCVSPIPSTILSGLSQKFSSSSRRVSIKALWKLLRSNKLEKWRNTWEGIGGTLGLLKILSEASAAEVKLLCRCISWSTRVSDPPEKREAYTELFKCLFSEKFKDAKWKNPDDRKFDDCYGLVGKACTTEFIEKQAKEDDADYEWKEIRDTLVWKVYKGYFEYTRLQDDLKGFPGAEEWIGLFIEFYPSFKMTAEEAPPAVTFSSKLLEEIKKDKWESTIRKAKPMKYAKNSKSFVEGVIYPLTRRAYKTRSSLETIQRILDLSLTHFEKNKTGPASLNRSTHDLLDLTLFAWATAPDNFDSYLRKFIKLYHLDAGAGIYGYNPLLLRVPMSLRYRLLRICMVETKGLDLDLNPDLEKSGIVISQHALELFPSEVVLDLYNRLKEVTGDTKFLSTLSHSPILNLKKLDNTEVDPDIWQIYLLHRTAKQTEANELALNCFTARRAKAATGSTPQIRAQRAREAVYFTIASGSPAVYLKSMEWILQRFIRDYSVVSTIFEDYTKEAKSLVVGIPADLEAHYNLDSLSKRVSESHQLLEVIFENMFAAAKEPSFNLRTWNATLRLIPDVIRQRMAFSERVRKALDITNDQVLYDILWAGLVDFIVKVEKKGLQSGYESLGLNTIRGSLVYESQNPYNLKLKDKDTPTSTYKFFDELAKARDGMWKEVREERGGTELPEIFPKGLPIQALTWPYTMATSKLELFAPYTYLRAQQAVYLERGAEDIISTDEETWASIGLFVDDFGAALRLLVPQHLDFVEKKARWKQVLHYAVENLSGRLDKAEAAVFWKYYISKNSWDHAWDSDKYTAIIDRILDEEGLDLWPSVPAQTTQEWNPREGVVSSPLRELKITYLDLSLYADNMFQRPSSRTEGPAIELQRFIPKLPAQDEIWSRNRIGRATHNPVLREGQILSAILYLKEYFGIESTVLSDFPGRFTTLIPVKKLFQPKTTAAVFDSAIEALTTHVEYIPPITLQELTAAVLKTTEDVPTIVKFIGLLTRSNTPSLASSFAISTVLKYPNSSSWHRHLLQVPYLSRLPKSEASECLVEFGKRIISILEENEKAKEKEKTKGRGQQPYVKITTIKHLSTLLIHPAISPTTAIEILNLLARRCTHHDARQSILDSLMGILTECTDEILADKVLTSLEFIIPIAGNLNPSVPISEARWLEAEEKKDVGVLDVNIEGIMGHTLLKTIFTKATTSVMLFRWKKVFITRILAKVIEELKAQTKRYIDIFLGSHGFGKEEIENMGLPIVPGSWSAWYDICGANGSEGGVLCPRSLLREFAEYKVFRVWLPKEVVEFGEKLKEMKKEERRKPGFRFWEEQYGFDLPVVGGLGKLGTFRARKETFEKMKVGEEKLKEEMGKFFEEGLYFGV
ncbi:hypothetical protein TWF506_002644 [Arthrobotrys conoides]|uniref:Uncharacterized protein n=1 Tax=Arthrobotrys conoides TaxID=74498 RepID=A0AAN8RUZ6_9PEZI